MFINVDWKTNSLKPMQSLYEKSKIAKNYTRIIDVTSYNCVKFEQEEKWQLYNLIIINVIHLKHFRFIS